MATVGLWKVCSSLNQVIKYTENSSKTDVSIYKDLEDSLKYVKNGFKTEKCLLVDGINCDPNNALKEMTDVKKRFMKTDGILAWHGYHSYKEGEITPELAQEVGMKVAEEMWGDRFQVVVTTHLNSRCIHNHFVVNSVSFVDGKKYYGNRTTYADLRRISNEICKEYGLSTLKEKPTKSGINYLNYQKKSLTYTNYYQNAKQDLDLAIKQSNSYKEFLGTLTNMGYEISNRAGKLSIKADGYKRNIRIERYFGTDYSIENIKKQIEGLYNPSKASCTNCKKIDDIFIKIIKINRKHNSFYGIYVRYCKLLNRYSNHIKVRPVSSIIWEDRKKLDELSEQAIFLVNNDIETEEQFFSFLKDTEQALDKLQNEKTNLQAKTKKTTLNIDTVNSSLEVTNNKILELKNTLNMCEQIRTRKEKLKANLCFLEEKEMINDELIK